MGNSCSGHGGQVAEPSSSEKVEEKPSHQSRGFRRKGDASAIAAATSRHKKLLAIAGAGAPVRSEISMPDAPVAYTFLKLKSSSVSDCSHASTKVFALLDNSGSMACGDGLDYCMGEALDHWLYDRFGAFKLINIDTISNECIDITGKQQRSYVGRNFGRTNISGAIKTLLRQLEILPSSVRPVVLLMTDGVENEFTDNITAAERLDDLSPEEKALLKKTQFIGFNIGKGATDIVAKMAFASHGRFDKVKRPDNRGYVDLSAVAAAREAMVAPVMSVLHTEQVVGALPESRRTTLLSKEGMPFICSDKGASYLVSATDADPVPGTEVLSLVDVARNERLVLAVAKQAKQDKQFSPSADAYHDQLNDMLVSLMQLRSAQGYRFESDTALRALQNAYLESPSALIGLHADDAEAALDVYSMDRFRARVIRASRYDAPPVLSAIVRLFELDDDARAVHRSWLVDVLGAKNSSIAAYDQVLFKLNLFNNSGGLREYANLLAGASSAPSLGDSDYPYRGQLALLKKRLDVRELENLIASVAEIFKQLACALRETAGVHVHAEYVDLDRNASFWNAQTRLCEHAANWFVPSLAAEDCARLEAAGWLNPLATHLMSGDPTLTTYKDAAALFGQAALVNAAQLHGATRDAFESLVDSSLRLQQVALKKIKSLLTRVQTSDAVVDWIDTLDSVQELMAMLLTPRIQLADEATQAALWRTAIVWMHAECAAFPAKEGVLHEQMRGCLRYAAAVNNLRHGDVAKPAGFDRDFTRYLESLFTYINAEGQRIVNADTLRCAKTQARYVVGFISEQMHDGVDGYAEIWSRICDRINADVTRLSGIDDAGLAQVVCDLDAKVDIFAHAKIAAGDALERNDVSASGTGIPGVIIKVKRNKLQHPSLVAKTNYLAARKLHRQTQCSEVEAAVSSFNQAILEDLQQQVALAIHEEIASGGCADSAAKLSCSAYQRICDQLNLVIKKHQGIKVSSFSEIVSKGARSMLDCFETDHSIIPSATDLMHGVINKHGLVFLFDDAVAADITPAKKSTVTGSQFSLRGSLVQRWKRGERSFECLDAYHRAETATYPSGIFYQGETYFSQVDYAVLPNQSDSGAIVKLGHHKGQPRYSDECAKLVTYWRRHTNLDNGAIKHRLTEITHLRPEAQIMFWEVIHAVWYERHGCSPRLSSAQLQSVASRHMDVRFDPGSDDDYPSELLSDLKHYSSCGYKIADERVSESTAGACERLSALVEADSVHVNSSDVVKAFVVSHRATLTACTQAANISARARFGVIGVANAGAGAAVSSAPVQCDNVRVCLGS